MKKYNAKIGLGDNLTDARRRWFLYNYIKTNCKGKINAKHKDELLIELSLFYFPNKTEQETFEFIMSELYDKYYSNEYSKLTKDIRILNEKMDKVIISTSGNGIFIPTVEEYFEIINRELTSNLSRLKRTYHKIKKANLNNQIRFDFTGNQKELMESLVNLNG